MPKPKLGIVVVEEHDVREFDQTQYGQKAFWLACSFLGLVNHW